MSGTGDFVFEAAGAMLVLPIAAAGLAVAGAAAVIGGVGTGISKAVQASREAEQRRVNSQLGALNNEIRNLDSAYRGEINSAL